jgi:hypothetical protein
MSSSIWTRCAGASERRPLRLSPWRAVEAQHQVSTRKLVDSLEEQSLLEDLIERVKPPDITGGKVHYLLATPFRYPPLRHGSRFGTRHERGLWYGAETRRTVFAEMAYYRLLFLDGTHADLETVSTELTVFTVRARSMRGIDLVAAPFARYRGAIASPSDYADTQSLGTAMRTSGVDLFRYPSARDVRGGVGIGILSPAAFGTAKPRGFETWWCTASRERVEVLQRDYFTRETFSFPRSDFLVGGHLPAPPL